MAPADVQVPGVLDAEEADARDTLENAASRSACGDTDVDTPDQDGIVVEQDPEPDSRPRPARG